MVFDELRYPAQFTKNKALFSEHSLRVARTPLVIIPTEVKDTVHQEDRDLLLEPVLVHGRLPSRRRQ